MRLARRSAFWAVLLLYFYSSLEGVGAFASEWRSAQVLGRKGDRVERAMGIEPTTFSLGI